MKLSIDKLRGMSGIYIVIHRLTGMLYVGSAVDLRKRFTGHISSARNGSKLRFHRALREFGPSEFDFNVVQYCPKEKLLERERFWIIFFNATSIDNLNSRENPVATYDFKPSAITRERMRAAHKGRKRGTPSLEHRLQLRLSNLGKKRSPETVERNRAAKLGTKPSEAARKAMSDAQKARNLKIKTEGTRIPMTDEQKAKIRATLKAKGIVPPSRKGTTSSEETRAKQSASLIGRKLSDEHKAKMSVIASNRSAEHLAKIGDAHRGKEIPAEMRERIRASLTGRKLSSEQLIERRAKLAITRMKKQTALSEQSV